MVWCWAVGIGTRPSGLTGCPHFIAGQAGEVPGPPAEANGRCPAVSGSGGGDLCPVAGRWLGAEVQGWGGGAPVPPLLDAAVHTNAPHNAALLLQTLNPRGEFGWCVEPW